MKVTFELPDEQTDKLVIATLKEAYESCVTTLMQQSRQMFDPVEDVIRRQAALSEVLSYFMLGPDYSNYIRQWNTKLMESTFENESKEEKEAD
jgi:hypothetical protein